MPRRVAYAPPGWCLLQACVGVCDVLRNSVPHMMSVCCQQAWERVCSTKKFHRYRPPTVQSALIALDVAREHHTAACEEAWRGLQTDCGAHYVVLRQAVKALAQLDALLSMALVAQQQGCVAMCMIAAAYGTCLVLYHCITVCVLSVCVCRKRHLCLHCRYVRPEVLSDDVPCCLRVEQGRHPVLDALRPGQVVPNDVSLMVRGFSLLCSGGHQRGHHRWMGGVSCLSLDQTWAARAPTYAWLPSLPSWHR